MSGSNKIINMKTTRFFMLIILIVLFQSNVRAQYMEVWNSTASISDMNAPTIVGVQNTDADSAKEIVTLQSWLNKICIIDGQSGILDGQISMGQIKSANLIDVNGNGTYEILFWGNNGTDWRWYLYGLNGTTYKEMIVDNNTQSLNYPNPFQQTTTIKYTVIENGSLVNIKVFDSKGRELKTLVNETKNAGEYEILFNGFDLSSGIYYYQINFGKEKGTKKMIKIE
jgi:hypothetical protein